MAEIPGVPFPDKYPDTLQLIATSVYESLVATGQPHQHAAEAALSAAERVRQAIGGALVYISKGVSHEADLLAKQIYSEWTGTNVPALARKYQRSEERIRQIIKDRRAAERASRQGSLL